MLRRRQQFSLASAFCGQRVHISDPMCSLLCVIFLFYIVFSFLSVSAPWLVAFNGTCGCWLLIMILMTFSSGYTEGQPCPFWATRLIFVFTRAVAERFIKRRCFCPQVAINFFKYFTTCPTRCLSKENYN